MDIKELGLPTFHGRVEAWECDFNGHWNTRFYCRAFQTAAEVVAALDGNPDPDSVVLRQRHLRFHRELHSGDTFEVRSCNIPDAEGGPVTAHWLTCKGIVSATVLDLGAPAAKTLPSLPAARATAALPRGLPDATGIGWMPDPAIDTIVELGPIRPGELHPDGSLRFESCLRRLSTVAQHQAADMGYSHEYTLATGIGRMLVEMRYTQLGHARTNDFLRGAAHITGVRGKSFLVSQMIYTHQGTPLALFEQCLLAVDMTTRKATDLPDIVTAALA